MGKGAFGAAVLYRKKDDGLMVVIKVSFLVIKVSCWWSRYIIGGQDILVGDKCTKLGSTAVWCKGLSELNCAILESFNILFNFCLKSHI